MLEQSQEKAGFYTSLIFLHHTIANRRTPQMVAHRGYQGQGRGWEQHYGLFPLGGTIERELVIKSSDLQTSVHPFFCCRHRPSPGCTFSVPGKTQILFLLLGSPKPATVTVVLAAEHTWDFAARRQCGLVARAH